MNPLPLIDLGGTWHLTYFAGLSFVIVAYVFRVFGKLSPLSVKLLLSWVLLWCVYLLEYPSAHFGVYTHDFQVTAAQVFIEVFCIPITVFLYAGAVTSLMPLLAAFQALCVWFSWPGLMRAPSFNMALACMCLPGVASPILTGFIVLTALTHHGSTALLIVAAQVFAGVVKGKFKKAVLFAALPVMALSAFLLQKQPMFNSGERVEKWIQFMTFWAQDWHRIIFGAGPGSFVWYSIMTHPYQTGLYLQLHCDYLEIVWALGLVGAVLAGWVIVDAAKRAWGLHVNVLQGLFGTLAFMLTYQPLEYYPSALLTAYFFSLCLVSYKKR